MAKHSQARKQLQPPDQTQSMLRLAKISLKLLQAARPLRGDSAVGPGSILVDGGTRGQLFIRGGAVSALLQGVQRELGVTQEEAIDALISLERGGLIRLLEG